MKAVPLFSFSSGSFLALAGAACLLLATSSVLRAEPAEADAITASKSWIALIDAGQYIESYQTGCTDFHQKVTQDRWVDVLKAFRPAYGDVVTRKLISHVYHADGVNGLNGECMVLTYDTAFSRIPNGFEQIILKFEDGKWRGAAYTAGPKPPGSGEDAQPQQPPPQIDTEVQSTTTQHPQQ